VPAIRGFGAVSRREDWVTGSATTDQGTNVQITLSIRAVEQLVAAVRRSAMP
jgi:hypothetical protein